MSVSSFGTTRGRRSAKSGGRSRPIGREDTTVPSVYIPVMPATTGVDPRRLLPSVDQALQQPEVQALVGAHGRPAVLRRLSEETMTRYGNRGPAARSFVAAILTQLVLPSDISGYFFGLLGYRARVYLGSLALAELPYAFGTVYLGNAFVERQYVLLLVAASLGLVLFAFLWLRSR